MNELAPLHAELARQLNLSPAAARAEFELREQARQLAEAEQFTGAIRMSLAGANLQLAEPAADTSPDRAFTGVAYHGGMIRMGAETYAIDLRTAKIAPPLPLLADHDHSLPVGVIERAEAGPMKIDISGRLFGHDPRAVDIVRKASRGLPWQLSVGIFGSAQTRVPAGENEFLNGRQLPGPFVLLADARIREVSCVTLGADAETSLEIL